MVCAKYIWISRYLSPFGYLMLGQLLSVNETRYRLYAASSKVSSSMLLLPTLPVVADAAERLLVSFLVEPSLHGDAGLVWFFYIPSACPFRSACAASRGVSPTSGTILARSHAYKEFPSSFT